MSHLKLSYIMNRIVPEISISNKLPGDADVFDPWSTLRVASFKRLHPPWLLMVESLQLRSFCFLSCIPLRLCLSGYEGCNLWSKPWLKEWLRMSSAVQLSHSVLFDSLRPHGLQHARLLCPSSLSNYRSLLKLKSIKSVTPSNHLIFCRPLLLPPSIFPSIRIFSDESVLRIRWPEYWSFSFSISPSNEYSGLISFRIDWLDLLATRDSQKSSPTSQFTSINSSMLSFLYSPTLTSIHEYWKNHSFD